ncbi:MAG: hypothetical protein ACJAT7_001531 [Psychromonas sp.]|jgi:hypothetical protein|uniref:hypothetical protein n=1 Tax=Psychromonas sp. TaxID=1884585 RepID=UPI0039E6CB09
MKKKDNMPMWVHWALLGINTRKVAMIFFTASSILSLIAIAAGIIIEDYSLATLLFVPLWYWISIKWVDLYSSWQAAEI